MSSKPSSRLKDPNAAEDSTNSSQEATSPSPPTQQQQQQHAADGETIWFREEEHWELTWPIWHMLPRHERKALAHKYGYRTIGEFEEFMSLNRAVGDTNTLERRTTTTTVATPYANEALYAAVSVSNELQQSKLKGIEKGKAQELEEEEEDLEGEEDVLDSSSAVEDLPEKELLQQGGQILSLPEELLHSVLDWLPIDAYAVMAAVSPHWKYFTRTEAVYKRLCERVFLFQSKRRSLNVARFGHSYRIMLMNRPRVRAGGGMYVLKYTSVKKIQRDMWTEVPLGAVLETVYYRYLYFQEKGQVLYALTSSPPHEMIVRFWKMCLTGDQDKAAVWGHYQVKKYMVTVVARQEWQTVRMEMTLLPDYASHGRFGALTFDRHMSSRSGKFDEYDANDVVEYKVPAELFRFLKDKRL